MPSKPRCIRKTAAISDDCENIVEDTGPTPADTYVIMISMVKKPMSDRAPVLERRERFLRLAEAQALEQLRDIELELARLEIEKRDAQNGGQAV